MIVRELKDRPEEVLATFDWFNDYKDTRDWAMFACPELVPRLDAGQKNWWRRAYRGGK